MAIEEHEHKHEQEHEHVLVTPAKGDHAVGFVRLFSAAHVKTAVRIVNG